MRGVLHVETSNRFHSLARSTCAQSLLPSHVCDAPHSPFRRGCYCRNAHVDCIQQTTWPCNPSPFTAWLHRPRRSTSRINSSALAWFTVAALPSCFSADQLACCMAHQHLTTFSPPTIAPLATTPGASHRQRLRSVPYSPEHHPRHELLHLDLLATSAAIFGTCVRHNRDGLPDRSITLAEKCWCYSNSMSKHHQL